MTNSIGGTHVSLIRDAEIRVWIYRHFVETGRAPSPVEIAAQFHLTPGAVEHRLRRLQDEADALVLLPGTSYIWMAEPFSAVPTSFKVRSGARVWWGNCIWDALAILALVGADGAVSTACPHSGQPLLASVTERGLGESQGISTMLLFRSEDDIVAWCEQRHITTGAVFDLARLWKLASVWYEDRLDSTWRRRTIPERQAMLDAVELTGSFWSLT